MVHVDALDRTGARHRLDHAALEYGYRSSRLQRGDLVVVSARLRFAPGYRHAMRREAISILAARRAKFPKIRANCGSVFVSDPKLYALIGPPGEAIERVAELTGFRDPERMRRAFIRAFGQPPQSLRRAARAG